MSNQTSRRSTAKPWLYYFILQSWIALFLFAAGVSSEDMLIMGLGAAAFILSDVLIMVYARRL